jgi:uncharacterized protein YcsI (UPF0317 family)
LNENELNEWIHRSMVIMPAKYAADFEAFCRANPGPCPLLAVVPAGTRSLSVCFLFGVCVCAVVRVRLLLVTPTSSHDAWAGETEIKKLAKGSDVRTDLPSYRVFKDGQFVGQVPGTTRTHARTHARGTTRTTSTHT